MKRILNLKMKLIYKYAIPIFMVVIAIEILIVAPAVIDQNKDMSDEAEIPQVNSNTTEQVMKGVHLVETRLDGKEWELWAQDAYNFKEDGNWILEDVKIRLFGADNIYYDVTGKRGQIDPKRENIRIEGEVNTLTSNGYLLKMNDVVYKSDTKVMTSDSKVQMLGPEIKGESRLVLTGDGMNTNMETNEVRILHNVRANKTLQKGQLVTLKSESAIFNAKNYRAEFNENLVVDYGAYRVSGRKGTLEVDPSNHRVNKVTVEGGVKLSDIQRLALSDKVTMHVAERKVTLSGDPRLIQNNNELKGEEITFHEESSQIQIKRAKAKFDKTLKNLE